MKVETLIRAVTFIAITATFACLLVLLARHEKAEADRRSSAIGCRVAIDGQKAAIADVRYYIKLMEDEK